MPHDIQLTDPSDIHDAERLFGQLWSLCKKNGEPWQQQEREARLREFRAELLGDE